jgi:hypothetical protein
MYHGMGLYPKPTYNGGKGGGAAAAAP